MAMKSNRLWDRLDVSGGVDSCWPWLGAVTPNGYGIMGVNGKIVKVHRVAWESSNGPIPPRPGYHGTVVMHTCDNRACCNPSHLMLGSQADNLADMAAKGRAAAGERVASSKLTESSVREIRARFDVGGCTVAELSREYGVGAPGIYKVVTRQRWRHVA